MRGETKLTRDEAEAAFDLLAEDERRVLIILLADHRGMANAISMPELARKAGVSSTRRLQTIVKTLTEAYGIWIGAGLPCGYFIIESQEEADLVGRNFRARGISNLAHEAAVRKISRRQVLDEYQLDIFGGHEAA